MNLYKEAKRPDGLVIRYEAKDGKTLFKLNPKRRELGVKKQRRDEDPRHERDLRGHPRRR